MDLFGAGLVGCQQSRAPAGVAKPAAEQAAENAEGVNMVPFMTPKGNLSRLDAEDRGEPADQDSAAARRTGRDARVLRGV